MSQNKHKVGDKVIIRSLDWYNTNKDEYGEVGTFVPHMAKYCGEEAIIEISFIGRYFIDIDNHLYYWTDEMFEQNLINMNKEDYVNFEQAKKLKKLGFNWECDHWYASDKELCYSGYYEFDPHVIMAPTLSQTQKWLREVKHIEVNSTFEAIAKEGWFYYHNDLDKGIYGNSYSSCDEDLYNSYEQALSEGITKALELLKENG